MRRVKWDSLMLSGSDKVEVYRNLRRRCWSVRSNKTGIVIDHVTEVELEDCELVVRQAGREKVRREGVKNVHAFVKGYMVKGECEIANCSCHIEDPRTISYDPYSNESFIATRTNQPVKKAKHILLTSNGRAFAKGIE